MAKLATSVLYSNPFVNKKVYLNNESFENILIELPSNLLTSKKLSESIQSDIEILSIH